MNIGRARPADLTGKYPEYYQWSRAEVLPFVPREVSKVLEVGCGEGRFGLAIKQTRNAEVWGIETVPEVAQQAAQRLDKVLLGDVEHDHLELPSEYFDCIIFNDVLEHLTYPWAVLKILRDALQTSGYVVASIPNIRYYPILKALVLHKEWDYTRDGTLDRTHFRFFTQRSIPKFFQDSGYELVRMEGINPLELSWKLNLAFKFLGGAIDDTRYLQFACVARKLRNTSVVRGGNANPLL